MHSVRDAATVVRAAVGGTSTATALRMQPQYVAIAWIAWAMDHGLAVVAGVLLIGGMLVATDLRADDV